MNIGALVKYYSIDDELIYGIVTKYFEHCEELHQRPAVEICWMDDNETTLEAMENLRDPDVKYIGVVSESR